MSKTGFVSFAEVKARVSLTAVLAYYNLRGFTAKGENLAGPCPFCGSKAKRAFTVSCVKNVWYCFGSCKAGGNVLDFVVRKEGVEIRRAAELLDRWFKLGLAGSEVRTEAPAPEEPPDARPAPRGLPEVNAPLGFALKNLDPAHQSLAGYGLSEATAQSFDAGYCAKGLMRDRIAVPIHRAGGELVGYCGLAADPADPERYRWPPNLRRDRDVFGLHREAPEIAVPILAPDILSALRLFEGGHRIPLALLDGSLSDAQEAALLGRLAEGSLLDVAAMSDFDVDSLVCRLARSFYVRVRKV